MKPAEDPGLKLLLLASLGLNLLLFGVVMGHVAKVLDSSLYGNTYRIERMGKLSDASQKKVRAAFEALREKQRAKVNTLYTLREDIEKVLATAPFDAAAYVALAGEYAKTRDTLAAEVQDTVLALAGELAPSERAVLSDLYRLPPRAQLTGRSSSKAMIPK